MAGARLASDMEGVALDAASFKAVVNKSALMAGLRHEWSAILDDCASTQLRLDTTGCLCTLCKRSDSPLKHIKLKPITLVFYTASPT